MKTKLKALLYCTVILTLLVLCMTAFSVTASAVTHSGTCGDDLTWSLDTETGVLSIKGTGEMANYSYTTFPWYSYRLSIKTVDIADGVTSIDYGAFYECRGLTSITIPDSVTSIADSAFLWCNSLTSITVEAGNSAYHSAGNCLIETASKKLIIGCDNSVIPNDGSVTSISSHAFSGKGLTSITIPSSVTSIGEYAFYMCIDVTSITVESGNPVYHSAGNCLIETATKTLIIGCINSVIPSDSSVTKIEKDAFRGCYITSIDIPYGITHIGQEAFACTRLTSVTIPNSVVTIDDAAFNLCLDLTSVIIPESVPRIGLFAFRSCPLTSITFLSPTTEIYDAADTITSTTVTIYGFDGSTAQAYAEKYGRTFVALDAGVVYTLNDAGTEYSVTGYKGSAAEVVIPNTYNEKPVTSIGNSAFKDCDSLTSITIPDSVTSIGGSAFYNCDSLTSITFGENCQLTSIGEGAFCYCYSLTDITIPDSVTSIGKYAFYTCDNLTSITIPFVGATKDGTSNTHFGYIFGAGSYSDNDHYVPASLKTVIVTGGTSIGKYAFYICPSLTSITIPDSVTSIGGSAFRYCYDLTSITIPDSVMSIGSYAFYGCDSLTSIIFESPTTGIYYSEDTIPSTASIYGIKGSTAESYAEKYNRTFVVLEGEEQGTEGLVYTLNDVGTEYSVTGYEGDATEIIIPTTYKGLPTTSISATAFGTVEIEDGYTGDLSDGVVLPDDLFGDVPVPSPIDQITFLSKTIAIPDSAAAIPADVVLCGYVNSTAHKYAQKYDREFIMLPEIYSASVSLGTDITVLFSAYLDDDQTDAVMEFTMNGKVTTVQGTATATPGKYQFAFTGVTPKMLGDNISTRLLLDGEELSVKDTYSVKQYCLNMKSRADAKALGLSDAQHEALATLVADILEYGAASQMYTGYKTSALVNADITGASEFVALGSEYANSGPVTITPAADGTSLVSAKLELANVLRLYFEFKTTNVANVTIKMGDKVYDADDFTWVKTENDGFGVATKYYSISSDAIYAAQFDENCAVTLCVDGVECQKLSYSVVNYIYNMQNSTSDENLTALLKRIRCYGLSAEAYAAAK